MDSHAKEHTVKGNKGLEEGGKLSGNGKPVTILTIQLGGF